MARYTIEIEGHHDELDMQPIREALESQLSKRASTCKIKRSVQNLSTGIILLETDLDLGRLRQLLNEIRLRENLKDITTRYGWVVPDGMVELAQLEEKEWDPHYFNSRPQVEGSYIYKNDLFGRLHSIFDLAFLCFGIWIIFDGLAKHNTIQSIVGLVLTCNLAWGLFSEIRYIECDDLGIKFIYVFKPSKHILWSEIQLLKIRDIRSEWCLLQTHTKEIKFPLSQSYKPDTKGKLIRTITARAGLCYFDYSGNAVYDIIYRRPNIV